MRCTRPAVLIAILGSMLLQLAVRNPLRATTDRTKAARHSESSRTTFFTALLNAKIRDTRTGADG